MSDPMKKNLLDKIGQGNRILLMESINFCYCDFIFGLFFFMILFGFFFLFALLGYINIYIRKKEFNKKLMGGTIYWIQLLFLHVYT